MKFISFLLILLFLGACAAFGQYHMRHYNSRQVDSSEEDDKSPVLRSYRRCMWEQSKFLPRRLVLLSLCANLFCENNQVVQRSSCMDILPEQCEQGDEEELMYKPFPDCCPVYCNLKRRMQRLKTMHYRHRKLLNFQHQQAQSDILLGNYNVEDLSFR
ncbi:PREDICTED: uncharacterized protein CG1552-like isoform X2 [Rhagoletis zephyria]|uniref:uncharacterized protein CG1552-like isoform X2 n=1 Tax=Rhagoletis zephyria TaxID=28612 RepID=UPI0008118500|nr:PREDICTED: uncharacterized protein CG1552-like isoform X2 [Rhagoletis zephyria]